VVPPLIELGVLWMTTGGADRALAVQVTSISPFGQFHDLRWLLVYNQSWAAFALEFVGLVAARAALNSLIAALAAPGGVQPYGRRLAREAGFTAAIYVLLLPWTVLAFGMGVVPISWLFLTAVPPIVLIAMVSAHGSLSPAWWRQAPGWRIVGWSATAFAAQTVAGLALQLSPAPAWPAIAVAGGGFNALAWTRISRAWSRAGPERARILPVVPAVGIGMLVVAVSGAAIGFAVVGGRRPPAASGSRLAGVGTLGGDGPPVLVVSGFDSKLDADTITPRFSAGPVLRFSYLGLDADGLPLPYGPDATHRSLGDLVRAMAVQVSDLHRRSGRTVAIVAESEGALVARVYAAAYPDAPVSRLVLLSPLDRPGRVFYPVAGRSGFGTAAGGALSLITDLLGGISPVHLPAGSPFLRSIVDHAPALRDLLSCRTGPPETLVQPLADSLADAQAPGGAVPAVVLPAYHGGLLTNRSAQTVVKRLLGGARVRTTSLMSLADSVLRGAAAGWQTPTLPLSLYEPSRDHPSCADMTARVRAWMLAG
jgi:hypothetical protein